MKFHIDTVQGLGTFMEIEAIGGDGTIGTNALYEQCQNYLQALGIDDGASTKYHTAIYCCNLIIKIIKICPQKRSSDTPAIPGQN